MDNLSLIGAILGLIFCAIIVGGFVYANYLFWVEARQRAIDSKLHTPTDDPTLPPV